MENRRFNLQRVESNPGEIQAQHHMIYEINDFNFFVRFAI